MSRRSFLQRVALLAALLSGSLLGLGPALSEGLAGEPGPLVQQGPKLTGGEESGEGRFGRSVALSADGDTALIGGFKDGGGLGAAWVFARSGSTWAQQGEKLTGGEESGKGQFGWSVALSAGGSTGLIGGINDAGKAGAAWAFGDPPPTPEVPFTPETPSTGGSPSATTTSIPAAQLATTVSAKGGVAAARAAGGRVLLARARIVVRGGWARVKLRCIAVVACRGRLKLAVKTKVRRRFRTATIGKASFSIAPGRTSSVRLRLSPVGRLLLNADRGRLHVALTILKTFPGALRRQTHSVHPVLRKA